MVSQTITALVRSGLSRLSRRYIPPEEFAYHRLRTKGFAPASVIDVGAYRGDWTRLVRRVFADVSVLMVEPQVARRDDLEKTCRELHGVRYVLALAGRSRGEEVVFFEMETGSSMFSESSDVPRRSTKLLTETLDQICGPVRGPAFLKVDVQGAELEVLEGAQETLRACELVQLEVALLPYNRGAPTMLEVLSYMAKRDFVPFDIAGFSRPNGVDLAQIDLLFARASSTLRNRFFTFAS